MVNRKEFLHGNQIYDGIFTCLNSFLYELLLFFYQWEIQDGPHRRIKFIIRPNMKLYKKKLYLKWTTGFYWKCASCNCIKTVIVHLRIILVKRKIFFLRFFFYITVIRWLFFVKKIRNASMFICLNQTSLGPTVVFGIDRC